MLLLQALPTSIGVAAIAPALLVLWLVIAADERPGPPARVWLAFLLGAASISLLGTARAGTALGPHRHHRDWARISSWSLALFAPVALHAAFDFPLLTLQKHPDLGSTTRMMLGAASLLIGFSSIGFAVRLVRRVGRHH